MSTQKKSQAIRNKLRLIVASSSLPSKTNVKDSQTPNHVSPIGNFLPRRLFREIVNVSPPINCKKQQLSAITKSPENSSKFSDSIDFKDSPNEGPEIDSPLCKELLKRNSSNSSCQKLRILGRGSFGVVVFGFRNGKKIAVKKAKVGNSCGGDWNAVVLNHKNVVKILNIYEANENRIVVMEYAGNQNLQEMLINPDLDLTWNFKLRCSIEISSALSYCHQLKVIHRDLKPANIVVSSKGVCRLTDFGCSLNLNEPLNQAKEAMVGTVPYLAPELLRGQETSSKVDIYAMGIVLWQLVTRLVPYDGEPAHSVIYKVVSTNKRPEISQINFNVTSRELINIAELCWSSEKEQRPSAAQLLDMLRDISS